MDLTTLTRKELESLNKTELIEIGKSLLDGVRLAYHLPDDRIVALLLHEMDVTPEDVCPTQAFRDNMEEFLHQQGNARFLQQKPCPSAKCTEWDCPALLAVIHHRSLRRYMI